MSDVNLKCKKCVPAKCCNYISLEINPPKTKKEFHEVLWYISHKDVSIYIFKRKWHINFDSRCEFLGKNNLCTIYDERPNICRDYTQEDWPDENTNKYDFEHEFHTREQFLQYLKGRKIKI